MDHHPDELQPGPLIIDDARLARCLAGWRRAEGVASDLLDLAAWSLGLVRRHAPAFAGLVTPPDATGAGAAPRLAAGRCLVAPADLQIAVAPALAVAGEVGERLRAAGVDAGAWDQFRSELAAAPEVSQHLVALNLDLDPVALAGAAASSPLPDEFFGFVVRHMGMVALTGAAVTLAPLVEDVAWRRGHCPICGSAPATAGLVGEIGARHLVCGLCSFVWTFPRLCCPFCGSEDGEDLLMIASDDRTPHHLDACRACGRYLKTIDFRKAGGRAVVLPIDDAATLYLDILAEQEVIRPPAH